MAVTEFNPMVRHMLTQEQKLRVKDTVPVLKENGIALRDYLYKRMLRNNPDLQEDFNMGSGAVFWLRSLSWFATNMWAWILRPRTTVLSVTMYSIPLAKCFPSRWITHSSVPICRVPASGQHIYRIREKALWWAPYHTRPLAGLTRF